MFGHIVSPGGSCSILAIRGPRVAKDEPSVGAVAGLAIGAVVVGNVVLAGAAGGHVAEASWLSRGEARRLADDLRMGRSFKTRWQKLVTQVSEAAMPFWVSSSLMAR
jgi:hypothetical protein